LNITRLKPYQSSLINSISLIALGGYGYLTSSSPSITALIPVIFGIAILSMNSGIKKDNKIIAHIAVLLTFLILLGLIMPLFGAVQRSDAGALFRVSTMLITTVLAMVVFIQSFKKTRKNKN
tara:strand:- start:186 stop:551 length:366 start_codon:yes stop_codon:yes gene_type:complete